MLSKLGAGLRIVIGVVAAVITLASFLWVGTRPLRQERLQEDQVLLRLVHWGDDREAGIVVQLLDEFEAKYPDIRVERIHPGGAEAVTTKVQTMVAAGDPPDVFQMGYEKIAGWADKGLLADLEPFIAEDQRRDDPEALRLEDFYTNVIDCYRYDEVIGKGPLYAIAKDFTTIGFYYNKDLLRKAGVPEPPLDGWTWEEFIGRRSQGRRPRGLLRRRLPHVGADAACLLLDARRRFHRRRLQDVRLQQSGVAGGLGRAAGLVPRKTRAALRSAKTQLETGEDPFLSGRIGFAGPLGRWKVPVYRLIEDFDWDFAPLPHAAGHAPANGAFSSAWTMSARTDHPDEAWLLIRFLSGEDGQRLVSEQGLAIPTMIRVAESKAFTDASIKPLNDQVYLDMVPARARHRLARRREVPRQAPPAHGRGLQDRPALHRRRARGCPGGVGGIPPD